MVLRLLVGLLLLASCGKQVNIDHTALEEASKLQTGSSKSSQSGVINKLVSGNTYLLYGNFSYTVSQTSSYNAKKFIEGLPMGETQVTFEGKVVNERNEKKIVVTSIKRR